MIFFLLCLKALRTTLKLLIVRHPFERLLSAYRDKLENKDIGLEHGVKHLYLSYGRKIVQLYRNGSSDRAEPTFREFVAYLIKDDAIRLAMIFYLKVIKNNCFYLIFDRFDDHWIPFYLFCTPCLVRYDVIAHVETLFRDQIYTIRVADLEGQITPLWTHLTKGQRSAGDTARKYFKQLNKWQVQQLFEKYRLDFELFGYDHEEYINYAQDWSYNSQYCTNLKKKNMKTTYIIYFFREILKLQRYPTNFSTANFWERTKKEFYSSKKQKFINTWILFYSISNWLNSSCTVVEQGTTFFKLNIWHPTRL